MDLALIVKTLHIMDNILITFYFVNVSYNILENTKYQTSFHDFFSILFLSS